MNDIDAYRDAIEKPTVKLNGKIYTGRLLSVVEALEFAKTWDELVKNPDLKLTDAGLVKFEKAYFYRVFPKPPIPWHTDVAGELMKLPPKAAFEVLMDFFRVSRQEPNPTASRES